MTITFLAIWLVDAARLSSDSRLLCNNHLKRSQSALRIFNNHLCNYTKTFFQNYTAAYRIAIIKDNIGKFKYDSMFKRTKKTQFMKSTSLRTYKVTFLTCNVFVFYKNLLCCLRTSCFRHGVNNGVNCEKIPQDLRLILITFNWKFILKQLFASGSITSSYSPVCISNVIRAVPPLFSFTGGWFSQNKTYVYSLFLVYWALLESY